MASFVKVDEIITVTLTEDESELFDYVIATYGSPMLTQLFNDFIAKHTAGRYNAEAKTLKDAYDAASSGDQADVDTILGL